MSVPEKKRKPGLKALMRSVFSRETGGETEVVEGGTVIHKLHLRQSVSDDVLHSGSRVRASRSVGHLNQECKPVPRVRKRSQSDIDIGKSPIELSPCIQRRRKLLRSACDVIHFLIQHAPFCEEPLRVGSKSVTNSECYYQEQGIYFQVWRNVSSLQGRIVCVSSDTSCLEELQALILKLLPCTQLYS